MAPLLGAPGFADPVPPTELLRLAGAQRVIAHAVLGMAIEDAGDGVERALGKRGVEQAEQRAPDQLVAGAEDLQRDRDTHDGVEPVPAAQHRGGDANDDAERSPDVGHEVMAVGLEGDGLMAPARGQEHAGDAEVDQRGHAGDGEPQPGLLDGLGVEQAPPGRGGDGGCREQDEATLERAGEVLGLAVPVGVLLVRRPGRDRQGKEGHQRGGEVDQRLEGIGEQADGAGDRVCRGFEPDGDQRRDDRDDREPEQPVALDHRSDSGSRRATSAMVSGALPSARLFTRR